MSVDHHLLKVEHVLLENICHILDLKQLVAVMLVENTFHAHSHTALLAEVLDWSVGEAWAENIGLTLSFISEEQGLSLAL